MNTLLAGRLRRRKQLEFAWSFRAKRGYQEPVRQYSDGR